MTYISVYDWGKRHGMHYYVPCIFLKDFFCIAEFMLCMSCNVEHLVGGLYNEAQFGFGMRLLVPFGLA